MSLSLSLSLCVSLFNVAVLVPSIRNEDVGLHSVIEGFRYRHLVYFIHVIFSQSGAPESNVEYSLTGLFSTGTTGPSFTEGDESHLNRDASLVRSREIRVMT